MNKIPMATISTDGACEPNPGSGGWAAIITWENGYEQKLAGDEDETTNNRMELTAIIQALKALEGRHTVDLFSDSQYCGNIMTGGRASANRDLVMELYELIDKHEVYFNWKSSSDPMMIRVDQMARAAIKHSDKPPARFNHARTYSGKK